MRCLYCHNPDTWERMDGTPMTVEKLLAQYEGVRTFLRNGGITATGGEPLLQIDFLTELFEKAKERGIHTCLDTSGVTFRPEDPDLLSKFDRLMAVTDLIMLDIKHIDDAAHRKLTGQPNHNILAFLDYLRERDKDVWIRHVVVPGITLDREALLRLGRHLGPYRNIRALDVIPYHTMGKVKYEKLGREYPLGDTPAATKEQALQARNLILQGMRETRTPTP